MPQVAGDPLGLYESAWKRYGDMVRLRALPGVYFFLLVHPEAVEHVLAKNHKNYRKPDSFNKPASLLAGKGLLTDEGSSWLGDDWFNPDSLVNASPHWMARLCGRPKP